MRVIQMTKTGTSSGKIDHARTDWLDFLRIIGSIVVVLLHASSHVFYVSDINSWVWAVHNLYRSALRWAAPIFIMISGALFLDPEREISIRALYRKYIFRIAVALIVWDVFYAGISTLISDGSLRSFAVYLLRFHYHMWYLLVLLGLYLAVPVLRMITQSMKTTRYFLGLSLFFTFIAPLLLKLPVLNKLEYAFGHMDFHLTLGYSCYFVAGYWLAKENIPKKARLLIYVLGAAGAAATMLLTSLATKRAQTVDETYYNNFFIGVMLQAVAVFVFARYDMPRLSRKEPVIRLKNRAVRCSFGIYMIHPFVILCTEKLSLDTGSFNPVAAVPAVSLLVWVLSLLITSVLRKIPFVNKYVV